MDAVSAFVVVAEVTLGAEVDGTYDLKSRERGHYGAGMCPTGSLSSAPTCPVVPIRLSMPFDQSAATPFADMSLHDRLAAIFNFEPIRDIDQRVLSHTVPPGRRYAYPPLLQFLVLMAVRIFGSQEAGLRELGQPGKWDEVCRWYCSLVGQPMSLPGAPPSSREQDKFVARLASVPATLGALSSEFTEVAIGQAVHQGQFPLGTQADFVAGDLRHLIFGDGTWQRAYSEVAEVRDENGVLTGHTGSRARNGAPRLQRTLAKGWSDEDEKHVDGVNNLFLGTWTDVGRIILACGATVEGEGRIAYGMITELAQRLRGRLHVVSYDRALKGWWLQDLMAKWGLLVVTRPIARASNVHQSDGYTARQVREEEALGLHRKGLPLPLGTTVYFTRGRLKAIRSVYHRLPTVAREVAICPHEHRLWVDAGTLFDVEVDPETHHLLKRASARALSAIPQPSRTLLTKELPIEWELPCPSATDGRHRFSTVWQPQTDEHERPSNGPQRALRDLRPMGVLDEAFWNVDGRRNNAESHNHWYKMKFNHHGRAMRIDTEAQFLDQLACSAVVNAIAWWKFNEKERLEGALRLVSGAVI